MREPHDVPLSRQALNVLKTVWPLNEEHELVFPSLRSHKKPLSENAFNSVLRNMGYPQDKATAHGFRATFRTWAEEVTGFPHAVIEEAMGHQVGNHVERAYRRTDVLEKRRELMAAWADCCEP